MPRNNLFLYSSKNVCYKRLYIIIIIIIIIVIVIIVSVPTEYMVHIYVSKQYSLHALNFSDIPCPFETSTQTFDSFQG